MCTKHKPAQSNKNQASGERSVSARDINAPVFTGNIVESIVKIYTAFPSWVQAVLFLILFGIVLSLGLQIISFLQQNPIVTPEPTPNPNKFEFVEASKGIAITALASAGDTLWVGGKADGVFSLYRADARQQTELSLESVDQVRQRIITLAANAEGDDAGRINQMAVDCKGNLWLLLNQVGVLVYQPTTRRLDTLLNKVSPAGWLPANTMTSIAFRCNENGTVDVWLGREGVRALHYQADYPDLNAITRDKDEVYASSKDMGAVRALGYVSETKRLWIVDWSSPIRAISPAGVLTPRPLDQAGSAWLSLSIAPDQTIWVGGVGRLLRIRGEQTDIFSVPSIKQVNAIWADHRWVWIGERCVDAGCQPLWYCQPRSGSCSPVPDRNRKEVTAITVDARKVRWFGTENGLFVYSQPD